jgi:hypothetical protein
MVDEQSRLWPVFIEIRDAVKAVLAPSLAIRHLIRNGRKIARSLCECSRNRKMQRSRLARIFGLY